MPNRGTSKYDWVKIKQEYLDSPLIEVEGFLRTFLELDPLKPLSSDKKLKAKGWRAEKLAYREKIAAVSELKTINNPDVQSRVQKLIKYTEMIEDSVSYIVNAKRKKVVINGEERILLDRDLPEMKDIKTAYDILRLATGKSTSNLGGDKDNPQIIEHIVKKIGE